MSSLLGKRIKLRRKQAGLIQQQVADTLGLSLRHYQRYESGKIIPSDDALKTLAQMFGVEFSELIELQDREISDTLQNQDIVSGDDSTTPEIEMNSERVASFASTSTEASDTFTQAETSEAPIQSARTERSRQPDWLALSLTLITIAVLATSGIAFWVLIGKNMYNTISGQVTCPNNQPVTAVWIVDENNDGKSVNKQLVNGNESVVRYRYTLPNGGGYNVHTGCGFLLSGQWAKSYRTERCSGTIEDRAFHALTVYEQPPADKSQPCLARDAKK